MVKKRNLIICMCFLAGLLYGITIDWVRHAQDATGFNHSPHLSSFSASVVYHHVDYIGICRGRYVENAFDSDPVDFGQPFQHTAFPSIAVTPPFGQDHELEVVAIPYLSGALSAIPDEVYPYYTTPIGTQLVIAVHVRGETAPNNWHYYTVPIGGASWVGVPSIVRRSEVGWTEDRVWVRFYLTFVRYNSYQQSIDFDIREVVVVVPYPYGGEAPTIYDNLIRRQSGGPDIRNVCTAVTEFYPCPPMDWCLPTIYLHTAWEDPGDIYYTVTRHVGGGPWEDLSIYRVEEIFHRHFNPHICTYGDRVYLTYTYWLTGQYPDQRGEIKRIWKELQYFDYPREYWSDVLDVSQSPVYGSEWSQGSATAVVWREERSDYWRTRLRDYEGGNYWEWVTDSESEASIPDFHPHIQTVVAYRMDLWGHQYRLGASYYVLWTEGPYPSATPYRIAFNTFSPSEAVASGDSIQIDSNVPIYYEITCGDSVPSYYCVHRDDYGTFDGHSVDIGYEELIYKLLLLKPCKHYLIQAVATAPDSLTETFYFNGEEGPSISLDPLQPETLYYLLPEHLYNYDDSSYVELEISGSNGAYLENLRVYKIDRIDTISSARTQGITSIYPPVSQVHLSITPNFFSSVTSVQYEVVERGKVHLGVYDAMGRLVKVLTKAQSQEPGVYTITWDGKNESGEMLSVGIYFLKLKTANHTLTKKIVLVR